MADCIQGIENREKIIALDKRITSMEDSMNVMAKDIKEIRERLLGRPSWAVCVIITLLSSLTVGSLAWCFAVLRLIVEVT